MIDPKVAALAFEARKVSLRQTKDGVFLSVVIHPSEVPPDIFTSLVGTRYQVVFVEIGDNEEPVVPPEKAEANKAVSVAGALCRNSRFQAWIGAHSEEGAAVAMRRSLGIDSRTELASNVAARKRLSDLNDRFMLDRQRGKA